MIRSIPVCMFHHVNPNGGDFITVHTDRFEAMMAMLSREGYTTLNSEEFARIMHGQGQPPERPVLLTFDDGWLDLRACAFPVLEHYGHRFTVFAVSDWTERASRFGRSGLPTAFPLHGAAKRLALTDQAGEVVCSWDDLRRMQDSGLCSIENHTASHGENPDLRTDIARGQEALATTLGVSSHQLCWPRGRHSRESLATARELGIEISYLIRRGVNLPGFGLMRIKRFTVEDRSPEWLKQQLAIFSRPITGYLYSRIKPDRLRWFSGRKQEPLL